MSIPNLPRPAIPVRSIGWSHGYIGQLRPVTSLHIIGGCYFSCEIAAPVAKALVRAASLLPPKLKAYGRLKLAQPAEHCSILLT